MIPFGFTKAEAMMEKRIKYIHCILARDNRFVSVGYIYDPDLDEVWVACAKTSKREKQYKKATAREIIENRFYALDINIISVPRVNGKELYSNKMLILNALYKGKLKFTGVDGREHFV